MLFCLYSFHLLKTLSSGLFSGTEIDLHIIYKFNTTQYNSHINQSRYTPNSQCKDYYSSPFQILPKATNGKLVLVNTPMDLPAPGVHHLPQMLLSFPLHPKSEIGSWCQSEISSEFPQDKNSINSCRVGTPSTLSKTN